jgi:hypothetical protein
MARSKRKSRPAPESDSSQSGSGLQGFAAAVMLVVSAGALVFILKSIATILVNGGICSRSGCRYWSTKPWALSIELAGLIMVLLLVGGVVVGSFSLLTGRNDEQDK